jgi:signal transduction histidine kinase
VRRHDRPAFDILGRALMPRGTEPTEAATPNIRPMVSGALFPLGVTVDRNIVRLFMATAISCLQLATMLYGGKLIFANLAASGVYVLWAIAGLFPPRHGSLIFSAPAWLGRGIELALCGAIIATGGPVLVAFLAAAVAMFMPHDYLRHITRWTALKALVIAAFVCGALLLGHRLAPAIMQAPASPIDEAFAALAFSLFAAALGGGKSVASTLGWDDELSHHVAFASKALADRLLELVAEGINGTAVMIFTPAPDRPIAARLVSGDAIDTVELNDETISNALYTPRDDGRPFLFNTRSGKALSDDRRQRVGILDMAAFSQAWNGLFGPARGAAFPITLGRVRGWLYVATGQDLSHRSYLEVRRVFADISAMIIRFERFDSWRERTLAEARLLASRDMHDSVLQTLAGLRMQLSSMVKGSETGVPATLNAQMKSLDAIVAAEQHHLREILQRSRDDAETAAELFSYLEARTLSLARQWNVRCTVQTPDEMLPVSEETAIECEFLLREAMSNAAQHASAEHILMVMGLDDNTLLVTLRTEGTPPGGRRPHGRVPIESRSLRQRVEKLGGSAYLESVSGGGILSIQIPLERK